MKFRIDADIFEKFKGLHIGVLVAKGLNNVGHLNEIEDLLRAEEARIRGEYSTETLSQNPKIDCWRKAYIAFGAKPKENRSSVENLYRLVLQGNNVRHINKVVDIYNLVSLKHMLPLGGEDIDKMQGDLILAFAAKDEAPVLLLGDKEARPPHEGEVIYKDEVSAVCRRWNWREADRTKLTEETRNCILVIEGLPPVSKDDVAIAVNDLKNFVALHCGGQISSFLLYEKKSEIVF